jgi:sporulation protein YqfC
MSSKSYKRPEKNKKPETESSLREKITEILELPKEIVLNVPKITIVGTGDMIVENYKGIMEYETDRVRINTGAGIIRITGNRLIIREITSEDILISGAILSISTVLSIRLFNQFPPIFSSTPISSIHSMVTTAVKPLFSSWIKFTLLCTIFSVSDISFNASV